MNCPYCNKTMLDGKYICKEWDYRIIDADDNLVFITETHETEMDGGELNDYTTIKYCVCGYYTYV